MSPLPQVSTGNREPLYNIGVVARMTGVSMATLRAWERRYSFPDSGRTSGGHRLYSENDVVRLRWVKERIDQGMQTAQAINALHHQEQTGNLALVEQFSAAADEKEKKAAPHISIYKDRLCEALFARDLSAADSLLGDALAFSSPEDVILDVIAPVLAKTGEAWESNDISVATEHLATNYIRQRLLMWMLSGPPPKSVSPIALACAPNEWHEGSLLILGALLRRRRWPIAYLGQSMPLQDLAHFLRDYNPSMAVLVAMTEDSASELAQWPQWLPDAAQNGKPIIGYGGRVFNLQPEWRLRVAGTYLGSTFREGLASIEHCLLQTL